MKIMIFLLGNPRLIAPFALEKPALMPKLPRPHKFQLCLSDEELKHLLFMAKKEQMTRSDLFRLKTIYRRLPRQTTQIAAKTYWQLSQEANNLNQISRALNATLQDKYISPETLTKLQTSLQNNLELLTQVRRELVELDLLAQLDEEEPD